MTDSTSRELREQLTVLISAVAAYDAALRRYGTTGRDAVYSHNLDVLYAAILAAAGLPGLDDDNVPQSNN